MDLGKTSGQTGGPGVQFTLVEKFYFGQNKLSFIWILSEMGEIRSLRTKSQNPAKGLFGLLLIDQTRTFVFI